MAKNWRFTNFGALMPEAAKVASAGCHHAGRHALLSRWTCHVNSGDGRAADAGDALENAIMGAGGVNSANGPS